MIKLKALLLGESEDEWTPGKIIVGVILKATHRVIGSDKVKEHDDLNKSHPTIRHESKYSWRYNKELKTLFFWDKDVPTEYIDDVKSVLNKNKYKVDKIENIESYKQGTYDMRRALYQSHNGLYFENPDNFNANSPSIAENNVENITNNAPINIDVITKKLEKAYNRDNKRHLEIILDWYHSDDKSKNKEIIDYINILNEVYKKSMEMAKNLNIPHVSEKDLIGYLLTQEEFSMDINSYFPMPLYISSEKQDEATVGVMMDINGKIIELHEGNDEATESTINMVNKLLNPTGKKVRIYGCHNTKLVFDIDETDTLPPNLYVSPNREVSAGYMDLKGERSMFTGIININDISQESDIDWKTIKKTKIEKFKWL